MAATMTATAAAPASVLELSLVASLPEAIPSETSGDAAAKGKTRLEAFWVISVLTGVTFVSVSGSGILTTALPRIAADIQLERDLIFWPASVYALTAGCTLLALGSVADVVGVKRMWLAGSGGACPLILACGRAATGNQFIVFRALLGVFVAMCLPTSMALVTASFPPGPRRNIAFAATGMGQPLGYALGLLLGGVLTDTIGWRWGFYITAAVDAALFVASALVLPADAQALSRASWRRLARDIDWVGVAILSASLGLLSYVLAMVTVSYKTIAQPQIVVLLAVATLFLPVFSLWVRWQEKRGRPALISNSVWQNLPFLFVCVAMFFTWAALNAFQYISTLFFQDVQNISALHASLRFLPMVVVGVLTNTLAAHLVAKVNVNVLLGISAVITAVSPVLMAVASPTWTYWTAAFLAMALSPVNGDVLWTVSNLVICRAFPADAQALAGGVFNTVSQLGNSVGLAVTAAISASVSAHDHDVDAVARQLEGYRAAYWTIFGGMLVVCVASFLGLRNLGKVGVKQD